MADSARFSIVIPAKDEADNLATVVAEIAEVLSGESFEVIIVDDGSSDGTHGVVQQLTGKYPWLRHLAHDRSCGKSAAILTGVRAAKTNLICTIDGDGQNDPRHIKPLLAPMQSSRVGIVAGQRVKHAHSVAKKIGSRFANKLRAGLLHDDTRDTACGLKAFRRDDFLRLPYFDTMHRFLPALMMREGLEVRHLDVIDRVRMHGQSKYGVIDRALVGLIDLFGMRWLIARRKRVPVATEIERRQS